MNGDASCSNGGHRVEDKDEGIHIPDLIHAARVHDKRVGCPFGHGGTPLSGDVVATVKDLHSVAGATVVAGMHATIVRLA